MVALIVEAARAARKESRLLRSTTNELRFAVRRTAHRNRVRLAQARAGVATARERRAVTLASPWSDLDWRPEDTSLERILLPLD